MLPVSSTGENRNQRKNDEHTANIGDDVIGLKLMSSILAIVTRTYR